MTPVQHTPAFTEKEASQIVLKTYGCKGFAKRLPSERDQNFHFTAHTGEQYVFKIANALEAREVLEAQNDAMACLCARTPFSPRVIPSLHKETISSISSKQGTGHFVRMVSYIPGIPLGDVKRHSDDLLKSIGTCLGQVARAFEGFDHPAAHRDFHWDMANGLDVIRKYNPLIEDPAINKLVKRFADRFEKDTAPRLAGFRKSVIHNDANDYNLIVGGGGTDPYMRNQQVVGIIDFGDMVYSYTVCDPAVAIAYAVLDKPDPLSVAAMIAAAYHAVYPLNEDELAVLFDLVCMRLCVSACLAAHQIKAQPENEYLSISQQPIRNTLPGLAEIHPRLAAATLRHACGLLPSQTAASITGWLTRRTGTFAPVLGGKTDAAASVVFDLGIGSPMVSGDPQAIEEPQLTKAVNRVMESTGAALGIGQYDEPRLVYTGPMFDTAGDATGEKRTVHIGIDLFAPPGTPVHAPIQGGVFAIGENKAHLDYGPMIILSHRTDDGETFYTLFGHLSREALKGLKKGDVVRQGDRIAAIGAPPVNGGWTPHLHFQIITDLLELGRDFPGVCRFSQRAVWSALSPDPNIVLGFPRDLFPKPRAEKNETLATRKRIIGKSLSIGYRNPLKIERGWMEYLYDETGRRYLDAYNNVPHLGHCHPRVVEAARRQMTVLNTNTRYLHDTINAYAERLVATLPDPLNVCFFVNSASEGNELALRLARNYTGQRNMVVLESAYHGHTTSLIDISPYKHGGPGGTGAPSWVHTAPVADLYRGRYKGDDPDAVSKYARHVLRITEDIKEAGEGVCGFIAESYPSVAGQIIFPPGYLSEVYRFVRNAGGVCIADEVQTGYGRTGSHFYAFETQAVVPDIVILGKPIGNGHPIGAVVTTPEIADAFDNGMEFFSTFGGNTVSCAVGLAVLETAIEENIQTHALKVGGYLLERLGPFRNRYSIVGDVRGAGLFLGIELVRDRKTLEPADKEASFVADRMREQGVLLGTDGPLHNVVKIRPPMPFSMDDADLLVDTMAEILDRNFS